MPRTTEPVAVPPDAIPANASLDMVQATFREMQAPPPPVPVRAARRTQLHDESGAPVYHARDAESGRRYRVEYLCGSAGRPARLRGRVALELSDLPPQMRSLPRLREDGRYEHVYERSLSKVQSFGGEERNVWYQPMFKQRYVLETDAGRERKVAWYGRLGSYWSPGVAAVAAEIARERHARGRPREEIECVEADIVQAAREFAR